MGLRDLGPGLIQQAVGWLLRMAGPGRQVYSQIMIVDGWTIRGTMSMIKRGRYSTQKESLKHNTKHYRQWSS